MTSSGPPSGDASLYEDRAGSAVVASGKSLNHGPVVGRDAELARIDQLLAEAQSGRTAVLLLEGEPGVGKTTLLASARARATGFTCLQMQGFDAESHLAHAGLLSLLTPVRDLVSDLPDSQAASLSAALGWSSGTTSVDRFLIGAATMSLVAAAADQQPVLVLVDDVQWLDRESSDALMFAARRLGSDAVAILIAGRSGAIGSGFGGGVAVLEVGGLSRRLLPRRCYLVSRRTWSIGWWRVRRVILWRSSRCQIALMTRSVPAQHPCLSRCRPATVSPVSTGPLSRNCRTRGGKRCCSQRWTDLRPASDRPSSPRCPTRASTPRKRSSVPLRPEH